jgi:DNA-binding MarR family transcriptional regulator
MMAAQTHAVSTNTGKPATEGCTCLRIRKAARRVTQIYDQHLEPCGLTITQYGLLGHLRRFDGIGIGALAEKLIMDPTTLTRSLRPLERRGFVTLAPDQHDRRSRRLSLTEAGRAAYAEAKPAWARAQRHIEQALGPADAVALSALLDRTLDQLAS